MKTKLIKLSDTHYIVVDDSEIKEGDWFYNSKYQEIGINYNPDGCKKITHSTQPLDYDIDGGYYPMSVTALSLSEVEELVNGYSVEKMADVLYPESLDDYDGKVKPYDLNEPVRKSYILGFKTHQELVKDKLFTIEDIKIAIQQAFLSGVERLEDYEKVEQMILSNITPKTEWDIEFVDGKMKLI